MVLLAILERLMNSCFFIGIVAVLVSLIVTSSVEKYAKIAIKGAETKLSHRRDIPRTEEMKATETLNDAKRRLRICRIVLLITSVIALFLIVYLLVIVNEVFSSFS